MRENGLKQRVNDPTNAKTVLFDNNHPYLCISAWTNQGSQEDLTFRTASKGL